MSAIIKMQIDKMSSWNVSKQAIKGTNGFEYCYALGFNASTVDAIPEEEVKAIDKIVKVMQTEEESTQPSDESARAETAD